MQDGKGIHCKYVPWTFRPLANKDNDYLMNRGAQKSRRELQRRSRHRHPGLAPAGEHGPYRRPHQGKPGFDRQRHHHGTHRLLRAAKELLEKGTIPPGVHIAHQRVRSASVILPPDSPYKDAAIEVLIVRKDTAPATV